MIYLGMYTFFFSGDMAYNQMRSDNDESDAIGALRKRATGPWICDGACSHRDPKEM
jgi:hypothetical protein